MAKITQKERVIRFIKEYGSISPLEAFWNLGITKLTNQIGYIEKDGTPVYRNYEKSLNRFGEPVYYMRYWLSYQQYLHDMQDYECEKAEIEKKAKKDKNIPEGMFYEEE